MQHLNNGHSSISEPSERWSRLRDLIEDRCLLYDPVKGFTLSTGVWSKYYFDCKAATLDGECLTLIADELLDVIEHFNPVPTAVGGLTLGADFITAALIMRAHDRGDITTHGSIVRKEPKKHGTKNQIENQLAPGTPIVVIDDVITSGKSIRDACREFLAAGYNIVGIMALVDRQVGGKEELERDFAPVHCLFVSSDFPALRELVTAR